MLPYNSIDQLKKYIQKSNCNAILFLNNYPSDKERNDGYFNRVLFIDKVFSNYIRCYINQSSLIVNTSIDIISEHSFQINIPENMQNHENLIEKMVVLFPNVYAHSIFALLTDFKKNIFSKAQCTIWDVHGVVPEEHVLQKSNEDTIILAELTEKFAFNYAKYILVVTATMQNHLINKHKRLNKLNNFILLPIVSVSSITKIKDKVYNSKRPIVIYSGGNQIWQQVEKMLKFVNHNKNKFDFIFLIADSETVRHQYEQLFLGEVFPGIIKSVAPEDVSEYYVSANYGLMLREDIIVNHVSCPTKLLDYISYNIIPIIDADNIGDFKDLGYKYVHYMDDEILTNNEYNDYTLINLQIFDSLHKKTNAGIQQLLTQTIKIDNKYNEDMIFLYLETINASLKINDADKLSFEFSDILNSTSWKITAPLRKLMLFCKNIM